MQVIMRWIDESDVYMLILGSRYGSIEPVSGKSYTQLEYEYAVEKGKPFFAVAISETADQARYKRGKSFVEVDNYNLLKSFRKLVTSKMVRFWDDARDIKIAILETMSEFSRRDELVGWIPGSEAINGGALAEEIARLTKENALLREQIIKVSNAGQTYNRLTFNEMYNLLDSIPIPALNGFSDRSYDLMISLAKALGDTKVSLLHFFWFVSKRIKSDVMYDTSTDFGAAVIDRLLDFGLIEQDKVRKGFGTDTFYALTDTAKKFLMRMRIERNIIEIEELYAKHMGTDN